MLRILYGVLVLLLYSVNSFSQQVGESLPPWKEGYLDLHHINTGRGDAALYILPDGTTFLLDAGELPPEPSPRRTAPHPDGSRPAYEWIARYVQRFSPAVSQRKLDYALITHFHGDHYGSYYEGVPVSANGKYFKSGITGVGDEIQIRKMIDRGYPDYKYPPRMGALRAARGSTEVAEARGIMNYWNFLDYHMRHSGMKVEALRAGRNDQIVLVNKPDKFPSFKVQNIKANGTMWTGLGSDTFEHFGPRPDTMETSENQLSMAIRIEYGKFRYYTGGDCPSIAGRGEPEWHDVGTNVAKAVGEVDVAVMDHHGNRDSHNEFNVSTLKPRVWIGQSWSANHPGDDVLRRIVSQYLYKGPRDVFTTNMMEANKIVIGPLVDRSYKSMDGHIVVRVMPGGEEYFVFILNDENERNEITAVFGPYQSKVK